MPLRRARRYTTADAFLVRPRADQPAELVRGEVRVMTPAGGAHGAIAGAIFAALHAFVEQRDLGICFPDNTGFLLPGLGDTARSPDVAFVCADLLPERGLDAGWVTVAPDLVVEVLSPTETASELEEKLRGYRTAGTRLVWVVDPTTRIVSVRTANGDESLLREGDQLDGGDVLPGFTLPITHLFARLAK